jgi:hypothetical protein
LADEIAKLHQRRHELVMESSRALMRLSVLQQQQQQQQQDETSRSGSCWQLDADRKQQLQSKFGLYLNAFLHVMGCLLVIFVPQRCELSLDPAASPPPHPTRLRLNATGICEFDENVDVHYLSEFNIFVLLLNFWTLLCVFLHSFLLNKREAFVIEAFDIDPQLPPDALLLFVTSSTGTRQAEKSWILRAEKRQRFFSGLCSLSSGFADVLQGGCAGGSGGGGGSVGGGGSGGVGNLWEQPHFTLQPHMSGEAQQAEQDERDAEEIKERLEALACANYVCAAWLTVTAASHALNVLLSAVLVWVYYPLDYRSFTVLITNVVAVSKMIVSHMAVLADPRHMQRAKADDGRPVAVCISSASLVETEQCYFNRLDKIDAATCC